MRITLTSIMVDNQDKALRFEVANIQREYTRLRSLGVVFTREPTRMGPVTIAVLSDTCGNLIQLYQPA